MAPNYLLIILCAAFSLVTSLVKQLYDLRYTPKSIYAFIIDVLLSTLSGLILSLILSEILGNQLCVLGFSGLGGLFGVSGFKLLMKLKLGKRIKIQIGFDEVNDENHV
jgi:hypothetical protein